MCSRSNCERSVESCRQAICKAVTSFCGQGYVQFSQISPNASRPEDCGLNRQTTAEKDLSQKLKRVTLSFPFTSAFHSSSFSTWSRFFKSTAQHKTRVSCPSCKASHSIYTRFTDLSRCVFQARSVGCGFASWLIEPVAVSLIHSYTSLDRGETAFRET